MKGMKAEAIIRKSIGSVNSVINIIVLTVIILLLAFAGYALWDSEQIHQAADKSHYAVYKPNTEDGGKSFKELQSVNADIFAWLSVYGTNIDYPVTQGQDNIKYINTNAEGCYSLSGAVFLDYNNSKNFSDFSSILYGHHMEKKKMFGEIGEFSDKDVFDSHQYGNLHFDGKDHGIEFFAFVHTDAYDSMVFNPNVKEEERQIFLDNLLAKAVHKRDIDITTEDNIILLSTCSSGSTNGRDILAGKISGDIYSDPFNKTGANDRKEQLYVDNRRGFLEKIPRWLLWPAGTLTVLLPALILVIKRKRKQHKEKFLLNFSYRNRSEADI